MKLNTFLLVRQTLGDMYSASQVDKATVGCFLVFHEITGLDSDSLKQ